MNRKEEITMKRIVCMAFARVILVTTVSCGTYELNDLSGIPTNESEAETVKVPDPSGADSVKTLVEKSLEFFRSDCDYSKIEDVHDPVAYLAMYIMEDLLRDRKLTFEQAREKAKLFFGTAEEMEKLDPELAAEIRDEWDVMEPDEAVNEYMSELRSAMRSGNITSDDPNYEIYSKMLTDWDKGADYMLENYPDMFANTRIPIGMDGALKQIRSYVTFQQYNNDLKVFKELECEFKPENINVGENGICSYDMGDVVKGSDVWMLDLDYYYKDGKYYIICYEICLGTAGG